MSQQTDLAAAPGPPRIVRTPTPQSEPDHVAPAPTPLDPSVPRHNYLTAAPTDELSWRPLQRSTRVAVSAGLCAAVFYTVFLFNPANRGETWLWVLMVLAEGLIVLHALGTWWTILAHDSRPELPEVDRARERLVAGVDEASVDVLITACGEPVDIVMGTAVAARDMHLPHRTFVCDDGRSDELEAACTIAGVGYLRRDHRDHAKAGNVNAALAVTTGEYVVILDADHVPSPRFLERALPHLQDRAVAFVQTPQSFPTAKGLVATGSAEAQRIFYELVSPGKNHFNGVFCVGTNVIFRRAALDQIGGIHTASNSEDIWTSLELHRRGWRSVFVPETLARGLAPDNLQSYFKQQFRWASGGFEVLLRGGLFRRGGLSLDQRLQYVMAGTNYLLSLAVLLFMTFPAAYLLMGWSPVRASLDSWLSHYLPFYFLILLVTWLQSGGFKVSAIVTSIASAPVQARALLMVLLGRKTSWSVTNSRSGRLPGLELVLPQVGFLLLNVAGIGVGLATMTDVPATLLSVLWASMYVLILGRVVLEAVLAPLRETDRLARRRSGARLVRAMPWPVAGRGRVARSDDDASTTSSFSDSFSDQAV